MAETIAGTITTLGSISGALESYKGFKLFIKGCDNNNLMVLERSIDNGITWSTASFYLSDVNGLVINESEITAQHRVKNLSLQNIKNIYYKLTKESNASGI